MNRSSLLYLLGSVAFIAGSLVLLAQARNWHDALPDLVYITGSLLFLAGTIAGLKK